MHYGCIVIEIWPIPQHVVAMQQIVPKDWAGLPFGCATSLESSWNHRKNCAMKESSPASFAAPCIRAAEPQGDAVEAKSAEEPATISVAS
jgi:hypothetical protein